MVNRIKLDLPLSGRFIRTRTSTGRNWPNDNSLVKTAVMSNSRSRCLASFLVNCAIELSDIGGPVHLIGEPLRSILRRVYINIQEDKKNPSPIKDSRCTSCTLSVQEFPAVESHSTRVQKWQYFRPER